MTDRAGVNRTRWIARTLLAVSTGLFIAIQSVSAANPGVKSSPTIPSAADLALKNAWGLYTQQKFGPSADAFEAIIRTASPSARLYYYASLANRAANRKSRAKQFCQYISSNFPTSVEASYAQKLFPDLIASKKSVSESEIETDDELPESIKDSLPKEMQEMLKTPEGAEAVKKALAAQGKNVAIVKSAEKQGVLTKSRTVFAANAAMAAGGIHRSSSERPFTAADIARDGAGGIDQSRYPNCWFEASMSALAELPRGQVAMANMIRYGDKGSYVVRFPGDGNEYVVTPEFIQESGIRDKALWATLIECAQIKKFPDNRGAGGADGDQSRLEVGLGCITGAKAEIIYPGSVSAQDLSSFIGGAVSSKNPIVCGTFDEGTLSSLPHLVVGQHAYTVTGFNPSTQMISIRNPHGKNSRRFSLASDPTHQQFEQLEDGMFKMNISLFQKYFYSIARSFI